MRCLEDWMKTMLVRFHDLRRFSETSSYLLIFHRTKKRKYKDRSLHNSWYWCQALHFLYIYRAGAEVGRLVGILVRLLEVCENVCQFVWVNLDRFWGSWIEFAISSTRSLFGTRILQSSSSSSSRLFECAFGWSAGALIDGLLGSVVGRESGRLFLRVNLDRFWGN